MKRLLMICLVLCFAVGIVACSSGEPSATGEPNTPPASNGEGDVKEPPKQSDKKHTITYLDGTWSSPIPSPEGEGVKKINEKFNVDYKPRFVPYDELETILPTVIAGGDMPDVIGMEGLNSNFVKWAKQGAFLPLNDYIDQYETLKAIPKYVLDAVTIDGKIYAIPQYFPPKLGKKIIIRQDWLDNLKLPMPTSYEELKQVAIAFAKNDPDQNGEADTYGLGLAKNIVYGGWTNVAYTDAWYHKNAEGQYIPGFISESYKKHITLLNELYDANAIHRDWAVSKTTDVRKDFFAGKIGIWYEQPYDFGQGRFTSLKELNPTAKLAVVPPFVQEDGEVGLPALSGYYQMVALNGKLKSDEDKVHRILQMQDYMRKFIPVNQRNDQNPDFDWQKGGVGVGYEMIDGVAIEIEGTTDLHPQYFFNIRGWAPSDEANEPHKVVTDPTAIEFVESAMTAISTAKFYIDPINRIYSPKMAEKGDELSNIIREYQTKMVVGQVPISDWDKMVDEYMRKGGKEVIDEVNQMFKDAGITGEWQ